MNSKSSFPAGESPPTGRRMTGSFTSQNPAPSSQDFRYAAGTPSLGLKVALSRSPTLCLHSETIVASCSSYGSLLSFAERRRLAKEMRGLGSNSMNSTTPSGCKMLSNINMRKFQSGTVRPKPAKTRVFSLTDEHLQETPCRFLTC
jgi:hypothetical protein